MARQTIYKISCHSLSKSIIFVGTPQESELENANKIFMLREICVFVCFFNKLENKSQTDVNIWSVQEGDFSSLPL